MKLRPSAAELAETRVGPWAGVATRFSVPENGFIGPDRYNQIFTVHGTTMMFLFAVRGYRRPGLVLLHTHQLRFQGRWQAGYLMARQLLPGVRLAPALLLDSSEDEGAIRRWLAREKPDVIITPASETLPDILARTGRRIPEDIGCALLACPSLDAPDADGRTFQISK